MVFSVSDTAVMVIGTPGSCAVRVGVCFALWRSDSAPLELSVRRSLRSRADEGVRPYTNFYAASRVADRRQRLAIPAASITLITSAAMNQYRPKYAAFASEWVKM